MSHLIWMGRCEECDQYVEHVMFNKWECGCEVE